MRIRVSSATLLTMRSLLLFCLCSVALVQAQLLPQALATFPADTISLEFDNLAALRKLPNYQALRQQYSSDELRRVKQTLLRLGIGEDQLSEVVTASGPNGFFGLLEGNFDVETATRNATKQNFSRTSLSGGPAFCSSSGVCVYFPVRAPRNASFGTLAQLRAMADITATHSPALDTNPLFAKLLGVLNKREPILGIAPGSEIKNLLNDAAPKNLSSLIDLPRYLPDIEGVGYSIDIDGKAHLTAYLLCRSEAESQTLSHTLNAASSLQQITRLAMDDALPFQNLKATPAGPIVKLSLDAKLR